MKDVTSGSQALATFLVSIKDAENLLAHFNTLNVKPPPPEIEVLKRAGLVMAMTAWETYVEDRVLEAAASRLAGLADSALANFVQSRLTDEIKRLHNPSAEKTVQLFVDYAGVDVSGNWVWNHVIPPVAKQRLNGYLKLRGDVVHRSRVSAKGPPQPDPVTKDDLHRAIGFLKELVKATDKALST
ncbi:HEPN domain-containing protein [Acidovorax sacchari]|uniref:HEPN domain-containing protein n=1 Tax=Acidovorax sacchari TaxID=3230736 RepID=UPI0039E6980C